MIGEENVSFDLFTEAGVTLELCVEDLVHDLRAAAFVFQHFRAVEPVLDMIAFDHDARTVPLDHRFVGFILARLDHQIEGRVA